jgi:hypothetical protein
VSKGGLKKLRNKTIIVRIYYVQYEEKYKDYKAGENCPNRG